MRVLINGEMIPLPDDIEFTPDRQVYIYTCSECDRNSNYDAAHIATDFTNLVCGWCHYCNKWRDERKVIWKCRDGRFLNISDMETSHIQACIAMIMNRHNWRQRFMRPLLLELEKRLGERE